MQLNDTFSGMEEYIIHEISQDLGSSSGAQFSRFSPLVENLPIEGNIIAKREEAIEREKGKKRRSELKTGASNLNLISRANAQPLWHASHAGLIKEKKALRSKI